ncbi:S-adenosyl-L-methionine-dependent methyltransferase [Cercophora newfieldiana]|uniref:S-adenosyl-L-methionine-dependent methyltransferase n=1 Tax=Cercophora newfieldiana TaxID=92897 RepID=A0AA40CUQ2_9PEZI|nr:S-adenosyl-L-methionine-dependent methyltransferase [Cercophora newfieldiana]
MGEIGATYMFMEWRLFDKIPTGSSISYKELAAFVGAEESVVSRIGGMLVASGRLVQTSTGHVTHSAHSKIFVSDHPAGNLFRVMIDHGLRGYLHWPEYFAQYGAKEPQGPSDNPFTFSWGHPTMNMWEVIAKDEVRQAIFSSGMRSMNSISAKHGGPASLYDFTWIGEEAIKTGGEGKELKKLKPLIVDVGGSHGDTLKHIMQTVPTIPQERCVLQDRPEVIEEAIALDVPELRNVVRIPHDFNDENPVKGALVYLLRRVLHDYGDLICIRILQRLSAVLPRDDPRARVLIMDQVLSDPPTPGNAAADMIMFNIGGKERSPAMFDHIVGEAGMKVVKIHRVPGTEVGVVECALK